MSAGPGIYLRLVPIPQMQHTGNTDSSRSISKASSDQSVAKRCFEDQAPAHVPTAL